MPLIQRELKDIEKDWNLGVKHSRSDDTGICNRYGFRSDLAPPVILFVNRESFGVASRFYSKTFSSLHVDEPHSDPSKKNCAALPQTFFDFANDILFLDIKNSSRAGLLRYFMPHLLPEETAKVRNLAIMARNIFEAQNFDECLPWLFNPFSGVENLFVIIEYPLIWELETW